MTGSGAAERELDRELNREVNRELDGHLDSEAAREILRGCVCSRTRMLDRVLSRLFDDSLGRQTVLPRDDLIRG